MRIHVNKRAALVAGVVAALLSSTGCGRGTLLVPVTYYAAPSNPPSGDWILIADVADARPSSANVGRCGRGMCGVFAFAAVTMEPVPDLVRSALVEGFRNAGYRVTTDASSSEGAAAVPLHAEIETFGVRVGKSGLLNRFDFSAEIRIEGDVPPFEHGELVAAEAFRRSDRHPRNEISWVNTIDSGLKALSAEVTRQLDAAGG